MAQRRAGGNDTGDGRLAAERLAGRDPVATLDLDGLSGGPQPVGAAARHQDQVFLRDTLQDAFGVGRAAPAAETLQERDVEVHVRGQCCRAAVTRELGLRVTDLADARSETAEFLRHREAEIARFGQFLVVRVDEGVLAVVFGGAGRELGAEFAGEADEGVVAVAGGGGTWEVAHWGNVRPRRPGD